MRVTPLAAGHVEYLRADGQLHNLDKPSDFNAVALEIENGLVLPEIMGVEGRLPPLRSRTQKNTGSLYAPKTSSIAARIS